MARLEGDIVTRHRLAIVASHVIQYQAPLFQRIAREPGIDLEVLYCSRLGAETFHDPDMGTKVRWDLDLLAGYHHEFLTNLSTARATGFLRHVNPGILPALARGRYDMVLFMTGWGSLTAIAGMILCRVAGIPFLIFGDSSFPPPEPTVRSRLRALMLRALFRMASGFAVSGSLNAAYYEHYGAGRERFFLVPFAIDNERFTRGSSFAEGEREAFRSRHGISRDSIVIIFSGKLVDRKDPMTLLRAYEQMEHRQRASLVFAGDGILRPDVERYAREKSLGRVHLAGFVNQSDLPQYYGASDVFALPSTYEPRGLVVNEAMASGLPVVVSDRCGAIGDIVADGDNGFVFPAGDAAALASRLDALAADPALRARMGARSREIIAGWSYDRAVQGIREALQRLSSRENR